MTGNNKSLLSEYLVESEWLEAHLDDPTLVIVDVDAESSYKRGHVPEAGSLHPDYERDPDTGWVITMPPDRFAEVCKDLCIGDTSQVVIYDNNMSLPATRLWWVLKRYGHTNVRVLNGGWRSWVLEKRPVSFEEPSLLNSSTFTPRPDDSMLGVLGDVKKACSLNDAVIWDVRTEGEYDGSVNRGNNRAGHIASAVHLEWSELMVPTTHLFKQDDEIREILSAAGITPDKTAYAY